MKRIYTNFLFLLLCLCVFLSCDDVMDTHKAFIEGGEIIYAPKPDTIYFVAGRNRIELNYTISKAPNVKFMNVYWDNGNGSLTEPLELSSGTETGKILINNLEEKSYTFIVELEDSYGHKSLKTSGVGSSYGDNYQASLSERRISRMSTGDNGGIIEWNIASENLVRNEIKYVSDSGEEVCLKMDAENSTLICPGAKPGGFVEYRSVYIPEEACVDTFYTAWIRSDESGMIFPHVYTMEEADRQNWELLYYDNSDPEEGKPEYILDNNPSSYWHSNYRDGQQKPYPFTFVIDMKEELLVGKLGAMSRENNHYTKDISYYVSADDEFTDGNPNGNHWTYIGEIELLKQNGMQWNDAVLSTLEKRQKGRFLKVICTSGHGASHLGAIAEITVQKVTEIDGEGL